MLMHTDEVFDAFYERIELLVRQQCANLGPDGLVETQVAEKYGEVTDSYTRMRLFYGLGLVTR